MNSRKLKIGCALFTSIIATIILILAISIGFYCWNIDHQMRNQRRQLQAAINNPAILNQLTQWAVPFFGQSNIPYSANQKVPSALLSFPFYDNGEPTFDDNHHIIAVLLLCGGTDNGYGLIVGKSTMPPECPFPIRKQLSSHVWYFDEYNNMPVP